VARAAASAAAEGAMVGAEGLEGGGLWAAVSRFLAGLTSTLLGKMALAAAAFLLMAGAGLLGYEMLKGKADGGVGAPDLGGISDSMRVRAGGDDRLGVAGKGEIRFDPLSAAKAPAATAPAAEAKAAGDKPAPDAKADAGADKPVPSGQLAHNLSGAKLSSSMGNDFGGKNIFGSNSSAPKFGGGAGLSNIAGANGHLAAMKASSLRPTASRMSIGKVSSNKAFGQALTARNFSNSALAVAPTNAEAASAGAQGAFDQQQSAGGNLNTPGAPGDSGGGGDTPPSLGGGAPSDPGLPAAPADPVGGSTDSGLQNSLSQISQMANQAMSDIQTGTIMSVLGGVLIGVGIGLMWVIGMQGVGAALIAAGAALLLMGVMKIAAGKSEEAQAIAMGQQLGQSIGNQQQANVINYCTQNAVATGTQVESCTPPESLTNSTAVSAQSTADANQVEQIPVSNTTIGPMTPQ
jgi:hypothetical protein